MGLTERFAAELARLALGEGPALIAVSGGLDSMVLLDLLVATQPRHGLQLVVAHVDHGIHPEGRVAAALVESRASSLGLALVTTRLALGPGAGESLARRERYRWLRAEQRRLGARWILTAHQADDQHETVLMRLLRGSGPAGLAGMPRRGRSIARPLLGIPRSTLRRYAAARALDWWEDPANRDPRHLRSWLRASLVPLLRERLPDVERRLTQARRHAVRGRLAWDTLLQRWPGLDLREDRGVLSVAAAAIEAEPEPLATAILEALLRRAGAPGAGQRVRRALGAIRAPRSGARADVGGGWSLVRSFDRLRLEPGRSAPSLAATREVLRPPSGQLRWGPWSVRWRPDQAPEHQPRDGGIAWFIPGELALRPWRPGDRVAPIGGTGHRLAAKCFQEARVPASERGSWPLVEGAGKVAWIPGVCRSGDLLPERGAPAIRVEVDLHA